jgi:hypothetical protein
MPAMLFMFLAAPVQNTIAEHTAALIIAGNVGVWPVLSSISCCQDATSKRTFKTIPCHDGLKCEAPALLRRLTTTHQPEHVIHVKQMRQPKYHTFITEPSHPDAIEGKSRVQHAGSLSKTSCSVAHSQGCAETVSRRMEASDAGPA